jgi:hypothetical protein
MAKIDTFLSDEQRYRSAAESVARARAILASALGKLDGLEW